MSNNSFIPPDYSDAVKSTSPVEDEVEDEEIDQDVDLEEEELNDIASALDKEDLEVKAVSNQEKENERIAMATPSSPFGAPISTSPFGAPSQTSPWGSQGGNTSSPWGSGSSFSRPQTPSWGTSPWQTPGTSIGQKSSIDRKKKYIFCDFIDGAVEAYGANGKPGLRPRDIYDLRPRFEVWDKLAAFNPERVFFVIPASLVPESANGINAWNVTLSYFCCSISSYLRIPYENCQIIKQSHLGQRKDEVLRAVLERGISKEDSVVIGIYSGGPSLSNVDREAAEACGIDYVDLNNLLNSMV